MKVFYVLLVSVLFIGSVFGQPNSANRNISIPTTASIGVNWDPQVSLYTGSANMSVPIYEISDYQYSLPINLTYSYSGLKYNDYASIVGLHWSLSVPIISRNIVDKDDFNEEKGYCFVPPASRNKDKTDMPDIFTFHCPEGTVKFFFPQSNVGAVDIKGELLFDDSGIFTITYNRTSKVITVNSIKGNVYQFDNFVNTKCQFKLQPSGTAPDEYFISSWYPSKIILGNKKEIGFQYSSSGQKLYSHTGHYGEAATSIPVWAQTIFASESFMYSDEVLLNKITWNNGYAIFKYIDRDDIAVSGGAKAKRLSDIEIYNSLNEPLKISRLDQDYFLNQNGTSKRLRLSRLLEYGNSLGNTPDAYTFQYDQNRLPDYSFLFPTFGYDSVRTTSAALLSVGFPTGLVTKYEYEQNDYNPDLENASTPRRKDLGTRVKAINQYNRKSELISRKNFEYKMGSGSSSGLVLSKLFNFFQQQGIYYLYLSNNWYPPVYQSEILGYSSVLEYWTLPGDETVLNGAKRTDFFNKPAKYGYEFIGAIAKYEYVNGRVIREIYYSGTKKDSLQTISGTSYSTELTSKDQSIKMFYTLPFSPTVLSGTNTLASQRLKVLSSTTTTKSFGMEVDFSREIQQYTYPTTVYNDYRDFMPLKKTVLLEDNIQNMVSYKYPHTLLASGSTHTIAKLAQSINGDKTTIVEELVHKKNGDIVSGILTDFRLDATSGVFTPLATYQLDLDSPLPASTVTVNLPVNSATWQINSGYKKYVDYIHNSHGRLLQISDRTKTTLSYIWGYNNLYPIAEIQNASYADVQAVLGATTLTALNSTSVTEPTITASMSKLRGDERMKKTLIASYIHKPLTGMSKKSDFRNISESYEMDGFQRLTAVMDDEGNVIKNYSYNRSSVQVVPTKFYNTAQSKTFTKNDCPPQTYPNYVQGTAVIYSVPAGKYTSSISQADANLKATDDINTFGQAHANKNGTCNYGVIIEW